MKKKTCLLLALFTIPGVVAQGMNTSDLPEPGAMPGDMMYGLEQAQESISLALTFNKEAKAEKKLQLAEERLSESVHAMEQGDNDSAAEAAQSYTDLIEEVNRTVHRMGNEELQNRMNQQIDNRKGILQTLQDRLPEQSGTGIERALEQGKRTRNVQGGPQNRVDKATGGFVVTGGAVPDR